MALVRARWGVLALGLAVGIGFWQRPEHAPRATRLAAPIRLLGAAFGSIGALRPSSDGRIIALGMQISSGPVWNGKPFIALFSPAQKKEVARLATSETGQEDFAWDAQNRLWTARGNGWDVWQAPWKTSSRVEAQVPIKVWKANDQRMLAFEPNTQTVVVSHEEYHEGAFLQFWRRGRLLFKANISLTQTDSGGVVDACEWSPDHKQLAISLGGWVGVDSEGVHEIWLLDTTSGQLRRVAQGDMELWTLADGHAQKTAPSWSRDGKTLLWGDQEFGVSQTDVSTSSERQVFGPRWSGDNPAPSPSGGVMAFTRRADVHGGGNATLVASALDGSWWARGPQLSSEER